MIEFRPDHSDSSLRAIREALGLDTGIPLDDDTAAEHFSAALVVAAELQCHMASLPPAMPHVRRLASSMFAASMKAALSLMTHPIRPARDGTCQEEEIDHDEGHPGALAGD